MSRSLFVGMAPAIVSGEMTLSADSVVHTEYCTTSCTSLNAVDSGGSTKWIFDSPASLGPHAEGLNGTVFATTTGYGNDMLFSLDGSDGSTKWEHRVPGNSQLVPEYGGLCEPLCLATDGTIYLTTCSIGPHERCGDGMAIDAIGTSGEVKWTFTSAELGHSRGELSAVGPDGSLLVIGVNEHPLGDTRTYSLDLLQPDTGAVKWSEALNPLYQFPQVAFTEASNVLLFQSNCAQDGLLSSLSSEDGNTLWNYPFPVIHYSASSHFRKPRMTLGDNEVFVNGVSLSEGECSLAVFDFNGNLLRNLPCLSGHDYQYSDVEDMFVSMVQEKANVLAHSGSDGSLLWNVSFPGNISLHPRANLGQDGTVFVTSVDEPVLTHAIRNGNVAWSVETGGGFPHVLVSEDGTTYIQGMTPPPVGLRQIIAVGADGVEKWRYTPRESGAELV